MDGDAIILICQSEIVMDTPLSSDVNDDYLAPYREAVKVHGASFDATLWHSRSTQTIRFDVLLSLVGLNDLRIVDAGCALGDLCQFLIDNDVSYGEYIGIDGLPSIIDKAMKRGLPRSRFAAVDFVADPSVLAMGNPDVIFFSGSLNTLAEATARHIVERAFEFAHHGVVFNFLSDECEDAIKAKDTGPATRFHTAEWIAWAFTRTASVAFRQDYLKGHDGTIAMFKPARDGT